MKRPSDLEDAGDRAQKQRKPGLVRVDLDEIGFWPGGRGGLGVSSHHLHEVAWDCKANKTKLQRYQYVDLIEVPKESLQQVLDANRDRCEADSLMPRFSPRTRYVCATKTHFVHAQKLAKEGTRYVFNKGEDPVRWQDADTEGAQIIEHGPLCSIYSKRMFNDIEAVHAVANQELFPSASPSMRGWVHSPSRSTSECDSE